MSRLGAWSLGHGGELHYSAQVFPAESMDIIAAAGAVLVHLKKEPLFSITISLKTQAYCYAGRPILMGVEGDAAGLVRRAGGGWCFESESTESLARETLALAWSSEAKSAGMATNCARFYAEHLAQARGAERFEGVFSDAIPARYES